MIKYLAIFLLSTSLCLGSVTLIDGLAPKNSAFDQLVQFTNIGTTGGANYSLYYGVDGSGANNSEDILNEILIGTAGQFFRVNGGANGYSWDTLDDSDMDFTGWTGVNSITTLGTIVTGAWQATDVGVQYGGTGVSTLTDGGVLLGSGTGAITPMAALADGEFIVGDGTTDPVAESGDTARISLGLGTTDSPIFAGVTATGTIQAEQLTSTDDMTVQGHAASFGNNTANDIVLTFNGSAYDGHITFDESGGVFDFGASSLSAAEFNLDNDEPFYFGTAKLSSIHFDPGDSAFRISSTSPIWHNSSTSHNFLVGTVEQIVLTDGKLAPTTDNDIDLGDATHELKDLFIDGTANIDSLVADTADINTGTVDATIGGTTPAPGTFTAVYLNDTNTSFTEDGSGNLTLTDAVAGALTLIELSCPPMVDVSDTTVAEGYNDVALTASKVQIKWIEIATSSTDWTLTVYEDDDAPGANPREILSNQNGDVDFYWDYPYEDEDASDEFHYQFEDDQPVEDYCVAQWYLDDNAASTAVAEDVGDFTAVASDNTDTMTTTGPWGAANTAMAFDDATTDEIVITDNALLQLSPEFTDDSQSGDLNCHQGVAADATHIYTIDNDTIHKRYRITPYTSVDSITGFLATINTEHSPATDVDHSGDGAVWDGYLYIISEHYVDTTDNDHQFLVKFQTSDMTYVSSVDISANFAANVGGGNLCIINGIIYVTMYETVTTGVMRFKLDGTYIDTVTMGTPLTYIDGITYDTVEEIFYLRGDVDSYYRYDTSFNQLCKILENPTGECKGLDFTQSDLGLMVVIDEGVDEKIHFLSKGAGWAPGWTLTAWVLIDDTSDAYNGIICRGGPDDRTYCLSLDAGSDDVYGGYETDYGTPGTNKFAYSTDGQLDFATWYFLGCTWDGQTVTTWINGESAGTPLATNNLPVVEADPVEIGRTIQSSDYNFDGKIASASIFKRALNATEMLELFNQQSASYDLANSTMNQEHDIEVKGYKLR